MLASVEREDINRIAAVHVARNARVFGSIGRGGWTDSSDLDLLVDMSEERSLFDLVALGADLGEALSVAVDVVTEKSLSLRYARPWFRRELSGSSMPAFSAARLRWRILSNDAGD
jgi:predicted nucleotidyltransferase